MGNNLDTELIDNRTFNLYGKTSRQLCDYCVKNGLLKIKQFSTYCIVNNLSVATVPYVTTLGMFYYDKYPTAEDLLLQLMEYKALSGKIKNSIWYY